MEHFSLLTKYESNYPSTPAVLNNLGLPGEEALKAGDGRVQGFGVLLTESFENPHSYREE